jgi:hypothetical protein
MSSELEDTMTAMTVTHLAAQEHINDLLREAERSRRVAEVRPSASHGPNLRLFRPWVAPMPAISALGVVLKRGTQTPERAGTAP